MYRVLGYTCLETGDYAKGVENMDKFFNMAAGDPQIITGRDYAIKGKLLARLGQDSIGAGMIIQAMKLDTSYKAGYDDIIEIYKKKYDKAAYWYGQKIKNTSAKPLDYFNWGQNLYLSKNYVRADSVFQLVENNFLEATLMRAKANNRLEAPDNFQGLGKPYFEKYIQINVQVPRDLFYEDQNHEVHNEHNLNYNYHSLITFYESFYKIQLV